MVVRQPKWARDKRFSKFCAPWTTRYFGQVKNINENVPDMPRFALSVAPGEGGRGVRTTRTSVGEPISNMDHVTEKLRVNYKHC